MRRRDQFIKTASVLLMGISLYLGGYFIDSQRWSGLGVISFAVSIILLIFIAVWTKKSYAQQQGTIEEKIPQVFPSLLNNEQQPNPSQMGVAPEMEEILPWRALAYPLGASFGICCILNFFSNQISPEILLPIQLVISYLLMSKVLIKTFPKLASYGIINRIRFLGLLPVIPVVVALIFSVAFGILK